MSRFGTNPNSAGRDGSRLSLPDQPGGLFVPPGLQRQIEALYARSPRPVPEVPTLAVRGLAPSDGTELLIESERINSFSPALVGALGAALSARPTPTVAAGGQL